MSDLVGAVERIPFVLNGFGPGQRPLDVTQERHTSAYNLLYNGGDEQIGCVIVSPGDGLPNAKMLTEEFLTGEQTELIVGPPGPNYEEPLGRLGVWALKNEGNLEVTPPPSSAKEKPARDAADRDRERGVFGLTMVLNSLYREGELPPRITSRFRQAIIDELTELGYSLVGTRYFGSLSTLDSWEEITRPFSEVEMALQERKAQVTEKIRHILDDEGMSDSGLEDVARIITADGFEKGAPLYSHTDEGLLVGPAQEHSLNPGILGVWAPHKEYWKARGVWHIDTEEGYTLDTRPAQVPWVEQLGLVEHLVEIRFVPGVNVRGNEDTTNGPSRRFRTVRDLIDAGSAPSTLDKAKLLEGVNERDFIPGPMLGGIPDGPKGYRTLVPGESVSFWRKARDPYDRNKLERIRYALKKGNIQPGQ